MSFSGIASGASFSATTISGGTLFSGSTNLYSIFATLGGSGATITGAANVGSGIGLFKQTAGTTLQFNSLSAGTNITFVTGDTITINSTASGGSSRISVSGTTTTNGLTNIGQITGLTSDSTHLIESFVTAKASGTTAWGTWKKTLNVTTAGNTPTVRFVNSDFDYFSSNLSATSVTFVVSGSNINIGVSGATNNTVQWDSKYEIIVKSSRV